MLHNLTRGLLLIANFTVFCPQDNALTTIPAGAFPSGLSSIDFQRNPIATIDQDAFRGSADTLTELMFSNARFTDLPDAFLNLNNLTHLDISDTQIKTWNDDVINHLAATLVTLILRNVSLTSWPTWIQKLPHLGTLELSSASFSIPDDGFDIQINTLFSLSLENGVLEEIPSAVSKLTKLQYLTLDNNNISRVLGIPDSPVMSRLVLDNNMISDAGQLSDHLRYVADSLTDLQLTKNQLTSLPDLATMVKLESIDLSYNMISYIGTSKISPSLVYLNLGHNNLQSLDSFMRNGFNLTTLTVAYNSILDILGVDIPASVQEMDISFNLLAELTDESFPANSNLKTLTLDSNPIAKVSSKAFASLTKLTSLSMSYTKITRLPLSLTYLTSAERVELDGSDALICTCAEKDLRSWKLLYHVIVYGECGVTSIESFINVMSYQCPD